MRAISASALIGFGSRTGRLAAYVDDIGPARLHLHCRGLGCGRIQIEPAIGERVRSDIEDAHHEGASTKVEDSTVCE